MIITLQKAQNQCKSRASYSFNIDLINLCSLRSLRRHFLFLYCKVWCFQYRLDLYHCKESRCRHVLFLNPDGASQIQTPAVSFPPALGAKA
jgi:hypothetical protein